MIPQVHRDWDYNSGGLLWWSDASGAMSNYVTIDDTEGLPVDERGRLPRIVYISGLCPRSTADRYVLVRCDDKPHDHPNLYRVMGTLVFHPQQI